MNNMSKIKRISKLFNILLVGLIIITPIYFIGYWLFINSFSESPIPVDLSLKLQVIGFISSLFPLCALLYGLINTKKVFSLYIKENIFSLEHVKLFKKIAKALVLWIVFSIIYESIKSVIFSWNNPIGERIIDVGIGSNEVGILVMSLILLVIAWIMDEARVINEENKLTV